MLPAIINPCDPIAANAQPQISVLFGRGAEGKNSLCLFSLPVTGSAEEPDHPGLLNLLFITIPLGEPAQVRFFCAPRGFFGGQRCFEIPGLSLRSYIGESTQNSDLVNQNKRRWPGNTGTPRKAVLRHCGVCSSVPRKPPWSPPRGAGLKQQGRFSLLA